MISTLAFIGAMALFFVLLTIRVRQLDAEFDRDIEW